MNALTTKGDFDDFSRPPRRTASSLSRFNLWLRWMSFWRITSAKQKNRSAHKAPATDEPPEDRVNADESDILADLTWNEAIAHKRLVALMTAHHAHEGLETIKNGGTPPSVPWYLANALHWSRSREDTRSIGVWILRTTEPHKPAEAKNYSRWLWTRRADCIRERVIHQHTDGVEHRRIAWQAWNAGHTKLTPDEARIIMAPLVHENEQQRALNVEVRAGLHLDGTLRANSAKVVWTAADESDQYPTRRAAPGTDPAGTGGTPAGLAQIQDGIAASVRWLTTLYRLEDLRPTREK